MQTPLPHRAFFINPYRPPNPRLLFPPFSISAATRRRRPTASATMYDLLSVSQTAGQEEIKAAYRQMARRWHPDACRSAEDKDYYSQQFMRAREAYRVLSDPALREDYDLSLLIGIGGRALSLREERFGDWRSQLDGLKRRSHFKRTTPSSWASRIRMASAE